MKKTGYEIKNLDGYNSMTYGMWDPETRYWYNLTLDGTYRQIVAAQQKIYDLIHFIHDELYRSVTMEKITPEIASQHLIKLLLNIRITFPLYHSGF